MRILITGSGGQLGLSLRSRVEDHPNHEFFFLDSKQLDITDTSSIKSSIQSFSPQFIINCAAYTAVDDAEDFPETAYQINVEGVSNLVEACKEHAIKLLHISTDYVFNGNENKSYTEQDETDPIGVYGTTKLQGEKIIKKSGISAIIIRTSWVFSEFGGNFVKTMLRLGKEKDSLNIVSDQYGCPTYAVDLAEVIIRIIESNRDYSGCETYHFSNEGITNWFSFATKIFELSDVNCKAYPIDTKDYPTKANRPKYSVLDTKKIRNTYGLSIRNWEEALKEVITKMGHSKTNH